MRRCIDVPTGDVMAGQGEVVLQSDATNACLVIVGYDFVKKIGGLAHAMFLREKAMEEKKSRDTQDPGHAVDEMIKDMTILGSNPEDIVIKLLTGENVPHNQNDPNYLKSLDVNREIIEKKHIRCSENSVADAGNTRIAFDVDSGRISYLNPKKKISVLRVE